MAEYKETNQNEFENREEETVELQRIVVLDKAESYPINGVNHAYRMGDVLAVRSRQARRYVHQVDNDIMDVRFAEDEDGNPEDPYEVKKSELEDELGKVGEVPRLKDKLEAMEG